MNLRTPAISRLLAALTLACLSVSALAQSGSKSADSAHAQAAVAALQQWYVPQDGLYWTTGWWNAANAITALANYSRVSRSNEYLPLFANTLRAAPASHRGFSGFINNYYDDEGWWALAWIDVYDLTKQPQYLEAATSIFHDMQKGWDTGSCNGGVWWNKKTGGKNAVENELFLAVAASLANRAATPAERRDSLAWAQKEWAWFRGSGMINSDHLVNDGLNYHDPAHCKNNGANTWSYNQGVILGGLVELNRAAPDPSLIQTARSIALAAIQHLTDAEGVLHESSKAHTGGDVPQFKGIFSRNLMLLNNAFPNPRYQSFARANAQALWNKDRDAANHFGFYWAGPFDMPDASRQSSALDALVAAAALKQ